MFDRISYPIHRMLKLDAGMINRVTLPEYSRVIKLVPDNGLQGGCGVPGEYARVHSLWYLTMYRFPISDHCRVGMVAWTK